MQFKHFLFVAVLATAILCFSAPVVIQAACSAGNEITCQINELLAQIAALQAQLTQLQAQQTVPAQWCHTFNVNLGIGSSGQEVDALIIVLDKESIAEFNNDNKPKEYNEAIASMVSAFQQKYASEILTPVGLRYGTGFVGVRTRAKLNSLYGCAPAVQSSITVTSPNGGETFTKNNTIKVQWSYSPLPPKDFYVGLIDSSGAERSLRGCGEGSSYYQDSINPNLFWFNWSDFSNVPDGRYKIKISNCVSRVEGGPTDDFSDNYFSIVSATQPTITVTSPNGGETWKIGETHNVTWTSSTNSAVYIILRESGSSSCTSDLNGAVVPCAYTIAGDVNFSNAWSNGVGTYSWLISGGRISGGAASIQPGNYVIQICGTGGTNCDQSDNYFSIVSAAQPTIQITTATGWTQWEPTKTYNITWQSNSSVNVNIELTKGNNAWMIATNVPTATYVSFAGGYYTGEYNWTVPNNFPMGDGYKIHVWANTNPVSAEAYSLGDISIVAVSSQPTITVTSPNGGEIYTFNDASIPVTWSLSNYTSSLYANSSIKVMLSNSNNVGIYALSPINQTTSNGYAAIPTGSTFPAGQYKIAVCDLGNNIACDYSDNYFSIVAPTTPTITVASPNGGEQWLQGTTHAITWTKTDKTGGSVKIELYKGGVLSSVIRSSTDNDGGISWNIPSTLTVGDDYKIKITSIANSSINDSSDSNFSIVPDYDACRLDKLDGTNITRNAIYDKDTCLSQLCDIYGPANANNGVNSISSKCVFKGNEIKKYAISTAQPTITVTSPNGGEAWQVGTMQTIRWTTQNVSVDKNVTVKLLDSLGNTHYVYGNSDISNLVPNGGFWSITVPSTITPGRYKVHVHVCSIGTITNGIYTCGSVIAEDTSDNYFTIAVASAQPSITVTSPNGGETWRIGETHNITWTSTLEFGILDRLYIEALDYAANTTSSGAYTPYTSRSIILSVPALSGSYSWTIPSDFVSSSRLKIRIGIPGDISSGHSDISDNYFTISAAPICGDINGSGKITSLDLGYVKSYLLGSRIMSTAQLQLADVNGDGIITISDSNVIQDIILNPEKSASGCNKKVLECGDINADGKINVLDLNALRSVVLGNPTDNNLKLGDVNGDGKLDESDEDLLSQKILGTINVFPSGACDKEVSATPPSASFNVSNDSLAAISAALQTILQQVLQLYVR